MSIVALGTIHVQFPPFYPHINTHSIVGHTFLRCYIDSYGIELIVVGK